MPDSLELPWVLRAVIPLMCGQRLAGGFRGVIDEFVAIALGHGAWRRRRSCSRNLPGLATVIGALNDLAEPATGLRGINTVGIRRRPLEVVHLPAGKEWPRNLPSLTFTVCGCDESAFARANQYTYVAHQI